MRYISQMKSLPIITLLLLSTILNSRAQEQLQDQDQIDPNQMEKLPYHQIPSYPESYTSGTVAARVVDGLGYRYYWSTEGLREEDLKFRPSENGRSVEETLVHIYGLSLTIVNAPESIPNIGRVDRSGMSWIEKRKLTLENFQKASQLLKKGKDQDMDGYKVIFPRGDSSVEYPFWNMLNGPISDAIYHVGQIVTFRRSSGNPMNPKVNVFAGKLRE